MVQRLQGGSSFMKMLRGASNNQRTPQTPGTPQQPHPTDKKVVQPPVLADEKHMHPTTPQPGTNKLTRMWRHIRRRRDDSFPRHGSASFVLHGEDAMAVGPRYHIVADGISTSTHPSDNPAGPSLSPSPSAVLARALVHAVEQVLLHDPPPVHLADFENMIVRAIISAQAHCRHVSPSMGSTLVVSFVQGKHLFTFSVGDSKCLVLRKARIAYETLAVMKEFNVPWTVTHHPLRSHMYVVQRIPLKKCDTVLTFSDGFGDNVYKDEVLQLVASAQATSVHPSDVCSRLVHHARAFVPADTTQESALPFAAAAAAAYVARVNEMNHDTKEVHIRKDQLVDRFKSKWPQLLARQVLIAKTNTKPGDVSHYSLAQLYRMATLTKKKPDDISVAMLEFG